MLANVETAATLGIPLLTLLVVLPLVGAVMVSLMNKAQAEQILKDFFNKNTPRSFSIIHRGESKDGAKYAIGNLTTSNGNYRVYYYFKVSGGSVNIQELRFMKE